jgi:hypothetical protein
MSKSPWGWRPTVVRRLINVVQAAGLQVERIEMAPDGRLIGEMLPLSMLNRPTTRTSGTRDQAAAPLRQRVPRRSR